MSALWERILIRRGTGGKSFGKLGIHHLVLRYQSSLDSSGNDLKLRRCKAQSIPMYRTSVRDSVSPVQQEPWFIIYTRRTISGNNMTDLDITHLLATKPSTHRIYPRSHLVIFIFHCKWNPGLYDQWFTCPSASRIICMIEDMRDALGVYNSGTRELPQSGRWRSTLYWS